jgi:L-aspartate oxidase
MAMPNTTPLLIIGAGLAGLTAALAAAPRPVTVLSTGPLGQDCSSAWAQGGIAAALSEGDEPAFHAADTIEAGAGLVDPAMADILTREGPEAVRALARLGVPFDRDPGNGFAQSLEAAHSHARVARVKGDQAGQEILRKVIIAVRACPSITVLERAAVSSLVTDSSGRVRGALVAHNGQTRTIYADAVILAAGGLGGLYDVTTNPRSLRGEGMALAALAGAVIADPEFVQFHPTAIDIGLDPAPLASEALRGEGARLVDAKGLPFMDRHHALAELAPRDVVARAIHEQRLNGLGAFLDAREAIGEHFPDQFPTVFAACLGAGLDPRRDAIPVAPAAHYHMGGVWTDAEGRTSLPGLYAIGECASTGVHGANRLASNSLLEAAVFGARAGRAAALEPKADRSLPIRPSHAAPSLPEAALKDLRSAMGRFAGVVRNEDGLTQLLSLIDDLERQHGPALALVSARLVASCALSRTESRGGHSRSDYPATDEVAKRTLTTLAQILADHPMKAAAE